MEKQKLGSTPNEAPTLRKAYLEPTLSLISFAPEQGFATSGETTATLTSVTYDGSTDTWQ